MLRLFLPLNFLIIVTSKCFTCSLLLFRKQRQFIFLYEEIKIHLNEMF